MITRGTGCLIEVPEALLAPHSDLDMMRGQRRSNEKVPECSATHDHPHMHTLLPQPNEF